MYFEVQSSSLNKYLFDSLTNDIYQLEPDFKIPSNATRESLELPVFSRNSLTTIDSQEKVSANAKTLIIELTEQCNLRCSYCVFDDNYENERSHSSKKISIDLAKKSIDDFLTRTSDEAYIIFYGGEPLLEFKIIKELTDYAKNRLDSSVKFSFTTNGMALTADKFDFLIENAFLITVSIDGEKTLHDKNRITINGNPSWDAIMQNLQKLQDYNPDFYKSNIQFNSVIDSVENISFVNEALSNNPLVAGQEIRFSFQLQDTIKQNKEYNEFNSNNYKKLLEVFYSGDFDKNLVEKDRLLNFVKKIAFRSIGEEAQDGKKKCIPFSNRTYVRTNGDLQFCERISDYKRVNSAKDIISYSSNIQDEFYKKKGVFCEKCIAYNFCEMCPASFYYDGEFSENHFDICNNYINEFKNALKLYLDLSEKNINFTEMN